MSRLRLGRLPARHDDRTLRLGRYLTAQLPEPPASVNHVNAVRRWPVYANDKLGDCTCASVGHLAGLWTTLAGRPDWPSEPDVIAAYSAVGGYRVGEPNTDRGAVMLDVLRYWRKTGVGRHRIGAFVAVDPADQRQVRAAVHLFGAVYVGASLPDAALTPTQAGHTWRLVSGAGGRPNRDNGHAFIVGGYGSRGLTGATWGMPQRMTNGWWSACVDEAWAIVSADQLDAAGYSPAGLDTAALLADLKAITA